MPFTSTAAPGLYPARPSYSKEDLCAAYVGRELDELRSPALLVDKQKVERNCRELIDAVQHAGVCARVHVKTHKTIEGALLQLGDTLKSIMVSTLAEARYFAASGLFQDILYAVPLSPDKIQEVHQLAQLVDQFHVFVDNDTIIDALERYAIAVGPTATMAVNPSSAVSQGLAGPGAPGNTKPMFRAFLKIDTGYGRAGIPSNTSTAIALATRLHNSPHISFSGLYSHSGHSYSSPNITSALDIAKHEVRETLTLAQELRSLGISAPYASIGATPSVKALLEVAGAGREAIMEARLATGAATALLRETSELASNVAQFALDDDQEAADNKANNDNTNNHNNHNANNPTPPSRPLPPHQETNNTAILQPNGSSVPHDYKLEVHLGNYIFLDVQQTTGMPWPLSRCAATVLTRVLSHYPHRNEVLIDAGATALSKDTAGPRGTGGFGTVLLPCPNPSSLPQTSSSPAPTTSDQANSSAHLHDHPQTLSLTRISQEHGIIDVSPLLAHHHQHQEGNNGETTATTTTTTTPMPLGMEIGQTLQIVPNHACLAAASFDWYYVVENEKVVDVWVPCRGW
ncbi:hypothetical protein DFJ77DRAFT_480410 [Powellomyces hirtus]|nr:hypothetical protein DFJ77DRAFT_480410 [Powellomyces hirtus]